MNRRHVSFLGLGPQGPDATFPWYATIAYELDGERAQPTPLVQRALRELLPSSTSHLILGTQRVRDRWRADPLAADEESLASLLGGEPFHFEPVPDGQSPEQLLQIFATLQRALSREARKDLGETEPPDEIVLDVTHGFRIQPMIGLAAVQFVTSGWRRSHTGDGATPDPVLRVLYGAFEAKRDDVAPVWDLQTFLAASRWNDAVGALVRFGQGDDLKRLGAELTKARKAAIRSSNPDFSRPEVRQADAAAKWPEELGQAAAQMVAEVVNLRTTSLLRDTTGKVRRQLESEYRGRWEAEYPYLREPLGEIERLTEALGGIDTFVDRRAMNAYLRLAEACLRYGANAAAITVVNESLSLAAAMHVHEGNPPRTFDDAAFADFLAQGSRAATSGDEVDPNDMIADIRKLVQGIRGPRNDLNHAGFRGGAMNVTVVAQQAQRAVEGLRGFLDTWAHALPDAPDA